MGYAFDHDFTIESNGPGAAALPRPA